MAGGSSSSEYESATERRTSAPTPSPRELALRGLVRRLVRLDTARDEAPVAQARAPAASRGTPALAPHDDDDLLVPPHRARLLVCAQERLADHPPRKALHVLEPERDQPLALASARSIAAANAAGSSGSARTAASPLASSSDWCAETTTGHAAGHRLDHRDPEALEPRGIGETAAPR